MSIKRLFIAAVCGLSLSAANAATDYYISTSTGSDSNACSHASPCATVNKGVSVMANGDTLYFMDGTYSGASNAFNVTNLGTGGASGSVKYLKAEHDGKAVISADLSMRNDTTPLQAYFQFEGFKFTSTNEKVIYGSRIKFLRCAFKGGPSNGNTVNTVIGGNDNGSNLARYILMEDCWWYGSGGRYKLLVFNSENIVLRRIVIRDDAGWNDSPNTGNPEAAFAIYNSSACAIQDMILIDSNRSYYEYTQAFYFIHNPNAVPDHVVIGNVMTGLIILNTKEMCIRADAGSLSNNSWSDIATADCENGFMSFGSNNNTSATVTRYGTQKISITQSGDWQGGMGYWGSGGGITATNGIVANQSGDDYNGVNTTYHDTYSNGSASGGTGQTTVNPLTSGWRYPVRIETGSTLKTAGSSGGQIGPNIVNKIGASETLWGETNYNADTGLSLWPYPNEARIKTDLQEITPTWGLASSTKTLTSYVWEYFGSSTPASVYNASVDVTSPTAPGTPTVTSTGTTTLDTTWAVSSDTETGVSYYEVDVSTDNFSTFSAGYNDFNMGVGNTEQLTGLTAGTVYVFRVRAVDVQGNTSSNSTAGTGTTSSQAPEGVSPNGYFRGRIYLKGNTRR